MNIMSPRCSALLPLRAFILSVSAMERFTQHELYPTLHHVQEVDQIPAVSVRIQLEVVKGVSILNTYLIEHDIPRCFSHQDVAQSILLQMLGFASSFRSIVPDLGQMEPTQMETVIQGVASSLYFEDDGCESVAIDSIAYNEYVRIYKHNELVFRAAAAAFVADHPHSECVNFDRFWKANLHYAV